MLADLIHLFPNLATTLIIFEQKHVQGCVCKGVIAANTLLIAHLTYILEVKKSVLIIMKSKNLSASAATAQHMETAEHAAQVAVLGAIIAEFHSKS